jgi:hypothetical protein
MTLPAAGYFVFRLTGHKSILIYNKGGGKPQSSGRECASRERPNPRVVILSYGASSCPLCN